MWEYKTLWEVWVDINKMWWLLLTHTYWKPITLCPWDTRPVNIEWGLYSWWYEIWEWIIFTKEEISSIFKPYMDDGITPKPFRLRQWRLWWKNKRRGLIRIGNTGWSDIKLITCDWWWAQKKELYKWQENWPFQLRVNIKWTTSKILM